jgi:hypothetical protein
MMLDTNTDQARRMPKAAAELYADLRAKGLLQGGRPSLMVSQPPVLIGAAVKVKPSKGQSDSKHPSNQISI